MRDHQKDDFREQLALAADILPEHDRNELLMWGEAKLREIERGQKLAKLFKRYRSLRSLDEPPSALMRARMRWFRRPSLLIDRIRPQT